MSVDPSHGWDARAQDFIRSRSAIGADTVRRWAEQLPRGASVLDIACGFGEPNAAVLVEQGFEVFGVDASPAMVAAFRHRFPYAQVACEAAETSAFFGRKFDAALAVGLLFLLPPDAQRQIIARAARALKPGGRFMFTAPWQVGEWNDLLTGRLSQSLGQDAYRHALEDAGLRLIHQYVDEGGNHYYDAVTT